MRTLIIAFLLASLFPTKYLSQSKDDYIACNQFMAEAEYYFHEGSYETAITYFQKGVEFVAEPHPMYQLKYAKALWKVGKKDLAFGAFVKAGLFTIDTSWFSGISSKTVDSLNKKAADLQALRELKNNCSFYNHFIDSLRYLDQKTRQNQDLTDPETLNEMNRQDSINGALLVGFIQKHGYPAGKNTAWGQTGGTILLHMPDQWYVENYPLLFQEVKKGNLEPWMLGRGIDRMFMVETDSLILTPYSRYQGNNNLNPFLLFYNCVSLGISPYYDWNWSSIPKKTSYFEYYKEHKELFNTTYQMN